MLTRAVHIFVVIVTAPVNGWANVAAGSNSAANEQSRPLAWSDLPDARRQQLVKGALDAFDHEGSPMVRALAARLLSLIALVDRDRVLPFTPQRATALRQLLNDTTADKVAADLAYAAYATCFLLTPNSIEWVEPPSGRYQVVVDAMRQSIEYGDIKLLPDYKSLHRSARDVLKNDDWHFDQDILLWSVETLDWLGVDTEDRVPLSTQLTSPYGNVRAAARTVLGTNKPDAAQFARLREAAHAALEATDDGVRLGAVEALSWLGITPEDIIPLSVKLYDTDEEVRVAARAILGAIRSDAALADRLRGTAHKALDAAGWNERLGAVETLNWLGMEPEDLSRLSARLDDPFRVVQAAARTALGTNKPDAAHVSRLRETARAALTSDNPETRLNAVETLGWLGVEAEDQGPLSVLRGDWASNVRAAVRIVLSAIKPHAAEADRIRQAAHASLASRVFARNRPSASQRRLSSQAAGRSPTLIV